MRLRPILVLCAASILAGGCADESPQSLPGGTTDPLPGASPLGDREIERDIRDLITAVTKLPATATAAEQSAWHPRRKLTLERLHGAGPELGRRALSEYREIGRAHV